MILTLAMLALGAPPDCEKEPIRCESEWAICEERLAGCYEEIPIFVAQLDEMQLALHQAEREKQAAKAAAKRNRIVYGAVGIITGIAVTGLGVRIAGR